MIENALAPVAAGGECTGIGLWEMTLSRCAESDSDHAAKWETSLPSKRLNSDTSLPS